MANKLRDLTGQVFGRLTVIERIPDPSHTRWRTKCSCGNSGASRSSDLVSGKSQSCGCRKIELIGSLNRTHGMTNTPEFWTWTRIISRCSNPKDGHWPYYGGQGVKVCGRWLKSFEAFYADIGPMPSPQHSIDRFPRCNGHYEPRNCRWATPKQQARNRRNNRLVEFRGEKLCIAEWAERYGMRTDNLWRRLKAGRPIHEALTTPIEPRKKR